MEKNRWFFGPLLAIEQEDAYIYTSHIYIYTYIHVYVYIVYISKYDCMYIDMLIIMPAMYIYIPLSKNMDSSKVYMQLFPQ